MKLSIIILSYNTKDLTLDCIKSIFLQYDKELKDGIFEIVVVDNASTDGSVSAISNFQLSLSDKTSLKIIKNKENYGFSKGNNIGAKNAIGEYLLFLNSDTEIQDKGFLRMTEFMDLNGKVGILGGRLMNTNKSFQRSAGNFYNVLNLSLLLFGGGKLGLLTKSPAKITKIDWVSGASMMVNNKTFKKIGGFEEKLFMYMEDMELCFRAQKKGFLTYFYPNVSLLHKERGSSNKTFAIIHIYEGILYFFKKYKPKWQYDLAKSLLIAKARLIKTIGKIIGNQYYINTYGQALELFKK